MIRIVLSLFALGFVLGVQASQPEAAQAQAGAAFPTVTDDGAWCWFADPRAVYHEGQSRKTYLGWLTRADSTVTVAAYDHDTHRLETAALKTVHRNDHANPVLLVRPDGRLMVFYSFHNGDEMFYRVSTHPEDVSAWGPEQTLGQNIAGTYGFTYPNPAQLSAEDDRYYLFWRGGGWHPTFSTSADGQAWTAPRTFVSVEGERPYLKMASNGVDELHFAFTDGHPRRIETNNIYYTVYRDGAFYSADGTRIGTMNDLPFTVDDVERVYDAASSGQGRAWIWDLALDADGHPVIVYSVLPAETDHRYQYARWTGTGWLIHPLTAAGGSIDGPSEPHYSGGIVLDPTDPNTVYLSREIDGLHELERWRTEDGGQTWTSEAITSGSSRINARPVVIRNHSSDGPAVFWMHGDYRHYTDYETGIKAYPTFEVTEHTHVDAR